MKLTDCAYPECKKLADHQFRMPNGEIAFCACKEHAAAILALLKEQMKAIQ